MEDETEDEKRDTRSVREKERKGGRGSRRARRHEGREEMEEEEDMWRNKEEEVGRKTLPSQTEDEDDSMKENELKVLLTATRVYSSDITKMSKGKNLISN